MRFATVEGQIALSTPDGYANVAAASAGRFGPDPGRALDEWQALSSWAVDQDAASFRGHLVPAANVRSGAGSGARSAGAGIPAPRFLGAPVPQPRQVFAIGLNYRDHVTESRLVEPAAPAVFTKFPSCLAGPHGIVSLPAGSVDWEVELVIVIGRRCERIAEGAAWSHVAGVGGARKPPRFLQPGDVLVSWVEGVGSLRNEMAAAPASTGQLTAPASAPNSL